MAIPATPTEMRVRGRAIGAAERAPDNWVLLGARPGRLAAQVEAAFAVQARAMGPQAVARRTAAEVVCRTAVAAVAAGLTAAAEGAVTAEERRSKWE